MVLSRDMRLGEEAIGQAGNFGKVVGSFISAGPSWEVEQISLP